MGFVRFEILTHKDRNEVLCSVRDAIVKAGGWVVDQTLFSNIAASISFELPARSFATFEKSLRDNGIPVSSNHLPQIEQEGDLPAIVSMTFSHTEPDMKREVPPFG